MLCVGCGGLKQSGGAIKVLVLGTSGSGKSTFLRQLQILHKNGFDDFEQHNFKEILLSNIVVGMKEILKYADKLEVVISEDNRKHYRYFLEFEVLEANWSDEKLTERIFEKTKALWADPGIQQTWAEATKAQLQMSQFGYLMSNLDRISDPNYQPSNEDILRARQRTTGQLKIRFWHENTKWEMVDVGGQKPERAKWKQIIDEGANAIIFFSALDEFNMVSNEDSSKTKMKVTMEQFVETLTSKETEKLYTVLLFNKVDQFEKKIQNPNDFKDFQKHFPEYKGGPVPGDIITFLRDQYFGLVPARKNNIKFFILCALDTNSIPSVFESIKNDLYGKSDTEQSKGAKAKDEQAKKQQQKEATEAGAKRE